MADERLLEYWRREREARDTARARLPASLRDDPRPRMRDVCETFIEAMLEMDRASRPAVAIAEDDR
jgi:hypothetical protein